MYMFRIQIKSPITCVASQIIYPAECSKAQSLPYIIGGLATGPHFAFWLNSQKDERVQTGEIAHFYSFSKLSQRHSTCVGNDMSRFALAHFASLWLTLHFEIAK